MAASARVPVAIGNAVFVSSPVLADLVPEEDFEPEWLPPPELLRLPLVGDVPEDFFLPSSSVV